jgi:hypothetical protein
VAYNFQTGKNKRKLLMEYESVTQKVLFGNALLVALMPGRKYDVISQNGSSFFLFFPVRKIKTMETPTII